MADSEEEEEMTIDAGIDYAVLDDLSNDEEELEVAAKPEPSKRPAPSSSAHTSNKEREKGEKKSGYSRSSSHRGSDKKPSQSTRKSAGSDCKRDDVDKRKPNSGTEKKKSEKGDNRKKSGTDNRHSAERAPTSSGSTAKDKKGSNEERAKSSSTHEVKKTEKSASSRGKLETSGRSETSSSSKPASSASKDKEKKKGNGESVPLLTMEEQGLRCKKEFTEGVLAADRKKVVVAYPLAADVLGNPSLQSVVAKTRQVHWTVDQQAVRGKPIGMLSMIFYTQEDAEQAQKALKKVQDGVNAARLGLSSSKEFDGQSLLDLVVKPFKGNFTKEQKKRWENCILIKDLPASITEAKLLKKFLKTRVTVPVDKAGKKKRHALVEFIDRQSMLATLEKQAEVEVDGHKLKLRDMMKSDVTPLVPKKITSKVQDMAALRHDLAKDWDTFSVDGRMSLIKNIHIQECQLRIDELVKKELGLKLGIRWESELEKMLRESTYDIPESLKHLASMPVAGLTKKVKQLESRKGRPKARPKVVRPVPKVVKKYGGRAERLLQNARQRVMARTAKSVVVHSLRKSAVGPMPSREAVHTRPAVRPVEHHTHSISRPVRPVRPLPPPTRQHSSSYQPLSSGSSLKRPATPPIVPFSELKRRRQDSSGDSGYGRRKPDRFDSHRNRSPVDRPDTWKHHHSTDNHRKSSYVPHGSRDRFSRARPYNDSRPTKNGRDVASPKSSSSYSSSSSRDLVRYYSELRRSSQRDRSPPSLNQHRSPSGGSGRRGSSAPGPSQADAMNLLVGLSQILEKSQGVPASVRSSMSSAITVPSPCQRGHTSVSTHGGHSDDSYSRRRNSDSHGDRRGSGRGGYSGSSYHRY